MCALRGLLTQAVNGNVVAFPWQFYALFDSERDCGARLYDYTTALVITYGFHLCVVSI